MYSHLEETSSNKRRYAIALIAGIACVGAVLAFTYQKSPQSLVSQYVTINTTPAPKPIVVSGSRDNLALNKFVWGTAIYPDGYFTHHKAVDGKKDKCVHPAANGYDTDLFISSV